MNRTLGLATLIAFLSSTPGFSAQEGREELKRYCTGDATTFCGDVDPASKAMEACFETHRKDLSENCRRAIDAYQAKGGK